MYACFGEICKIIFEVNSNRVNQDEMFILSKQEDIVNYLFRACLSGDIPKKLEEFRSENNPKYAADMASRFIRRLASVNENIVSFLQRSFSEERLDAIEEYLEASQEQFPKREVAYKMLELFENPSFNIAPLNKSVKGSTTYELNFEELKELYGIGEYDRAIAIMLFYAVAYISNKVKKLSDEIATNIQLSDEMLQDIDLGKYYERFERHILILSDKDQDFLEIDTTTRFVSRFLKPKTFLMDSFSHYFRFETELTRSKHQIESLIINGVEYKDVVRIEDSEDKTQNLIYCRTYYLDKVPRQKQYEVTLKVKAFREFPAYHMSYRLPVPCRHFSNTIEIKGRDKSKWQVELKMFAPVSYDSTSGNQHKTPPNTTLQHVLINEWIPAQSGYYVYARPKHEHWKDYIKDY